MTIVNNVTRLLDAKKIPYTPHALPEEKLGAVDTAQLLNVPPAQVFKSIVAVRTGPGKPLLGVVPGDQELNLKLLAKAAGEKKVSLATHTQAEQLTGLQTGGISPLALVNKGFQIFVDQSALSYAHIFVSGGQRGLNIEIAPKDLVKLVNARLQPIAS